MPDARREPVRNGKVFLSEKSKALIPLHLMVLPALIFAAIFCYLPMYGVVIAFQKFDITKGFFDSQRWIGFDNFRFLFRMNDFWNALRNSFTIAGAKLIAGIVIPVTFSLLLNEVRSKTLKKSIQTAIYLPHFLSWVVLSGILITVLSPSKGMVNRLIVMLGSDPIFFLGDNNWFQPTLVISDLWKEFGWGTIVYLAALSGVDPELYESAIIDGAGRWKQTLYITLPGISHIVTLMSVLAMGRVLNAGFEQVFNLYSPLVYSTGDILDTLTYRIGLVQGNFSISTTVGLFKSLVSLVFIALSRWSVYRFMGHRVF